MKMDAVPWQALDSRILASALSALGKRKGYASFWDSPDKGTKERGIVCDLLASIEGKGGRHGIVSIRKNRRDPPDCVGTGENNEIVAFEVTELVDEETIRRNKKGQRSNQRKCLCAFKEWTADALIEKIRNILKAKDEKRFHGGPYSRIVLIIHTDEPLLRHHA